MWHQALRKGRYIPIFYGGGITGDVQVNDTHAHHCLKTAYRLLESELMLKKLKADPNKVPAPTRDEMMDMCVGACKSLTVDVGLALKQNFMTNNFDES